MTTAILGEYVAASTEEFPRNERERWFKIAPFGEQSAVMASGHQFTIDGPGPVKLPADPTRVHVNAEHDRRAVVGRFNALKETAAGIFARYVAASTQAGNDALSLIDDGLRTGISVELERPVIRAGRLLHGELSNAALTVNPSFTSATALAAAADVGEVTADLEAAAAKIASALEALNTDEAPNTDSTDTAPEGANNMPATATAAKATDATATAAAHAAAGQAAAPKPDALVALASAQAQITGMQSPTVKAAALDYIAQGDVFDKVNAPEYAGELWKGRRYAGRYLDLLAEAPMTSQTVVGWRWVAGKTPEVAMWTPNAETGVYPDIHTNEVKAEQITYNGFRIAGGHAVDRIHIDLPSAEWWGSYNEESTDDYARKLDAEVIKHLTAPANVTNLSLSTTATNYDRLLEGIGAALDFADPDYALIGWDVFREFASARLLDQQVAGVGDPAIIAGGKLKMSILGLEIKVAPRSQTAQADRMLIGCKPANRLRSLPGGPVRVNAEQIQTGKVEHGVFGYHILESTDPRGMIDVTADDV